LSFKFRCGTVLSHQVTSDGVTGKDKEYDEQKSRHAGG